MKLSRVQLKTLRLIADFECYLDTYGVLGPCGALRCLPDGDWSKSWQVARKPTIDSLFSRWLVTQAPTAAYRVYLTTRGEQALDGHPEAAV